MEMPFLSLCQLCREAVVVMVLLDYKIRGGLGV